MRFSESSSLLSQAINLIEEGPQPTSRIAGRVFGVRSGPPGLAARMVFELLAEDHRVRVDGDGVWRLAADAGREDRPLDSLSYVVVDVETTGIPVSRGGRIIEIAAVQVRDGAIRDEFTTLVNPGGPIPRWVSDLTGISHGMVASAPRFEEVCDQLRRRLEGRVFVAHNAAYDWAYVSAEMRRARLIVPSGHGSVPSAWPARPSPASGGGASTLWRRITGSRSRGATGRKATPAPPRCSCCVSCRRPIARAWGGGGSCRAGWVAAGRGVAAG